MIIWTIQPESLWAQLQSTGELTTDTEAMIASHGDFWQLERQSYEWLAEQMSQRISPRPAADAFPLWGWYQCQGVNRKRPDLRQRGHVARKERAVRLEVEIPDSDVLLSDFEMWHAPLNCWYLARSLREDDCWDKLLLSRGFSNSRSLAELPDDLRQQKEKSWERIFHVNHKNCYWGNELNRRSIQATFWKLSLDQVRKVTHFVGR